MIPEAEAYKHLGGHTEAQGGPRRDILVKTATVRSKMKQSLKTIFWNACVLTDVKLKVLEAHILSSPDYANGRWPMLTKLQTQRHLRLIMDAFRIIVDKPRR